MGGWAGMATSSALTHHQRRSLRCPPRLVVQARAAAPAGRQLTKLLRSPSHLPSLPCSNVAATHAAVFRADRTQNLIVRLRHNVIRAGLRRISLAYSRISLADVSAARQLGLEGRGSLRVHVQHGSWRTAWEHACLASVGMCTEECTVCGRRRCCACPSNLHCAGCAAPGPGVGAGHREHCGQGDPVRGRREGCLAVVLVAARAAAVTAAVAFRSIQLAAALPPPSCRRPPRSPRAPPLPPQRRRHRGQHQPRGGDAGERAPRGCVRNRGARLRLPRPHRLLHGRPQRGGWVGGHRGCLCSSCSLSARSPAATALPCCRSPTCLSAVSRVSTNSAHARAHALPLTARPSRRCGTARAAAQCR